MTQLTIDPAKFIAKRQAVVSALFRLWTTSMPSEHIPSEDNFAGWLDTFGAEVAAAAIRRTANKARRRQRERAPMSNNELEAYATGTMKCMGREAGYGPIR